MDGIISAAARVTKVHLRNDDDMVDRLHHRYTVLFLVIFTAVVSTTQYVGDPISCWCPAYFTENHVDYTNKVLRPFSPPVVQFRFSTQSVLILLVGPKKGHPACKQYCPNKAAAWCIG